MNYMKHKYFANYVTLQTKNSDIYENDINNLFFRDIMG